MVSRPANVTLEHEITARKLIASNSKLAAVRYLKVEMELFPDLRSCKDYVDTLRPWSDPLEELAINRQYAAKLDSQLPELLALAFPTLGEEKLQKALSDPLYLQTLIDDNKTGRDYGI